MATLAGAFLLPSVAHAVQCDEIVAPNKIYGAGGSAVTATLRRVAVAIANDATGDPAERTTIFYTDPNACDGYADFLAGESTRVFKYWVAGTAAVDTDKTCEARIGGQPLDFGHMGNAADLCPDPTVPEGIGDFQAPIQTVNIVTGLDSPETSISAEALYILYGFGPALAQATPWSAGTGVFSRQSTAFVTYLVGAHANLDSTLFIGEGKWAEVNAPNNPDGKKSAIQTNGAVISEIEKYATDETKAAQALGYVSGSTADGARKRAKTLAFQGFDQTCGVYPDSTPTAFDKLNVRYGKYALWAQGHYFAPVDEDGVPTNERVANLIKWFSGDEPAPGTSVNVFNETIKAGDIPACAMNAKREGTTGAFSSYAPPKPCTGRYEFAATEATEHDVCEADAECSGDTPKCNYGYCEAYREDGQEEG